jgi:hypothetical protein
MRYVGLLLYRFLVPSTGHRSWQNGDPLKPDPANLLWSLRGVSKTSHLHAVIFSNYPARRKVDIVTVDIDLRPAYLANAKDDLDLWSVIDSGSRTNVTLFCHRSGFHVPSEVIRRIAPVAGSRTELASIAVRPNWECASQKRMPDGPTYSRLPKSMATAFASAWALLQYAQGPKVLESDPSKCVGRASLYLETHDLETVECCLKMVSWRKPGESLLITSFCISITLSWIATVETG